MAGNSSTPGQSVISKVVSVLGAFSGDRAELSMSEISRATGLPTSTVHRIVHDLVAEDALSRTPAGQYVIGLKLWGIASRTPHSFSLAEASMPYLQQLLEVTHEHVHLAALHGRQALVLEKLSWPGADERISRAGRVLPLHASATGQVLLAHAAPEMQEEVLTGPLAAYTPETIVDPMLLRRRLAAIRRQGYSRIVGELVPGLNSCAAPVFWRDQTLAGSIGAIVHLDGRALREVEHLVWTAAKGLTVYLSSPEAEAVPRDLFRPLPAVEPSPRR